MRPWTIHRGQSRPLRPASRRRTCRSSIMRRPSHRTREWTPRRIKSRSFRLTSAESSTGSAMAMWAVSINYQRFTVLCDWCRRHCPAVPLSLAADCALTQCKLGMAHRSGCCRAVGAVALLIAASCAGRADSACSDGAHAIITRAGVLCAEEEGAVAHRALLEQSSQDISPAVVPFPSRSFAVAPRAGTPAHNRISGIASAGAGASLPLGDGSFGGLGMPPNSLPVLALRLTPLRPTLHPTPARSPHRCRTAVAWGVSRRNRRRPRSRPAPLRCLQPRRPPLPPGRRLRGRDQS